MNPKHFGGNCTRLRRPGNRLRIMPQSQNRSAFHEADQRRLNRKQRCHIAFQRSTACKQRVDSVQGRLRGRFARQHRNLWLEILIDQRRPRAGLDTQHIAIEAGQLGQCPIDRVPLKPLVTSPLLLFEVLDRSMGLARLGPLCAEPEGFLQCGALFVDLPNP